MFIPKTHLIHFINKIDQLESESETVDILGVDLIGLLISIIVGIIFVAPILWIVGRSLVGKEKAKFTDAIWIVVLGIIIGALLGAFINGWLAALIMLIIWLALVKHFFDCGWLMAFAISVVAVIIFIVIILILAAIGIAVIGLGLGFALF